MIINDYIIDDGYLIDDSEENEADSNDDNQELSSDKSSKETSEVVSENTPVEDAPVEDVAEVKSEDAPVEDATEAKSEDAPVEDATEAKSEDASVEDAAESKSEDAPVEEANEILFPYLIGKKVGMTQLFSEDGQSFPVTVLEAGPCSITQIKNDTTEGYNAVQLGYEDLKKNKINKAVKGHFSNSNVMPKKYLKEFITSNNENYKLGDTVTVNQFSIGDFIRITGTSKGKGFTGHMKRHGFGGGRASHGKNSVMRKAGSVGAGSDPSRVFPGMKMAGRKGNYNVSIKNLLVVRVDQHKNLMFVNGSVPGAKNSVVYLSKV